MNKYYETVLKKEKEKLKIEMRETEEAIKSTEERMEDYNSLKGNKSRGIPYPYEEELDYLYEYADELKGVKINLQPMNKEVIKVDVYYGNGNIKSSGLYRKGKKEGYWIYHHLNGQVNFIGCYFDELLEGTVFRYFRAGKEGNYIRKAMEEEYEGDKLNGSTSYFDTEGEKYRREKYVQDQLMEEMEI